MYILKEKMRRESTLFGFCILKTVFCYQKQGKQGEPVWLIVFLLFRKTQKTLNQ